MKIEVKQHSQDPDYIETDDYNSKEIFMLLTEKDKNNNFIHSHIQIGDNIYSPVSVQSIRVIDDETA